ncbi:unnamed protein product [Kuraishia capsulata CBS 1993]|uniref:C2H2-type domain-containing protein n=1 Tax=Kuraishia capsulata CBS 1993 TaxID=1382522 RepID=W6MKE4_9ASCO|nr:uncharacterized protein KUCA_T00001104001 [Kuraishia capsulata CBS 1993]CDK25137.1 unnamed protein product [Kuraishia capsulata CBS 1993]
MEHPTQFQVGSAQQSHSGAHHHHRRSSIHATSSGAPYSIPLKLTTPVSSSPRTAGHFHTQAQAQAAQAAQAQLSSSVPLLSREFVVRRISEGETGRLKEELKCEACGKGYKHISSLAKHLWEHTPEWNVTKKLLISKHQQVQLLEAASILCSMNETQARRQSVSSPEKRSSSPEDALSDITSNSNNSASTTATAATATMTASSSKINRKNSMSQYPPSTPFFKQAANRKSPSHESTNGGYLDTTSAAPEFSAAVSQSISKSHRGADGLLMPTANDDEGEQDIDQTTRFAPRSDEVIEDDDEDTGVFGEME